jgi:hypothetical protein
MPLQCRQVGKRRPLITVTSYGISACAGVVGDGVDAGLRHDLARLVFLRHKLSSRIKLIDDP